VERRVDVDGCLNFRDLGGYPTESGGTLRWRQLFRADGLHALSARGVATVRDQIGLGDIIDLRSSAELALDGRGPLEREAIRFHHLPLFDGPRDGQTQERAPVFGSSLAELYFGMIDYARGPIAKVVTVLARTRDPAVFHCAAGKDRTGVVTALVLGLLGVEDEQIVADYMVTATNMDRITDRFGRWARYRRNMASLPAEIYRVEEHTIRTFLRELDHRYGGAVGWARTKGVEPDAERRLASALLDGG